MSFVSAAVAIGFEGVAANIAAGAMMGGSVKVGTNVLSGEDPFKDVGKSVLMGGLTGGLTPGVSEAFGVSMPMAAGITQGGLTALATGDLSKGLMAGMGAYGMYGLTGAGEEMGLNQAMSGPSATGEQVFGDTEVVSGSMGDKFNKYLTNPNATGAAARANATGNFFKDNSKYLMAAAGPIMADIAAKNDMPQTVTQPGMIRPFSYDPYSGAYTAGNPYEVTAKKAADGGLMAMNNGGYNPGQLDFTQKSEPVVRMASGGIAGYALGGAPKMFSDEELYQQTGSWEAAAAARDEQNRASNIYNDAQRLSAAVAPVTGGGIKDLNFSSGVELANTNTNTNTAAAAADPYYFQVNPDVAASFKQNSYGMTPEAFAQAHYTNFGQKEGREFAPSAAAAYAAANNIDLVQNANQWILDHPFATNDQIKAAMTASGLSQGDVNRSLNALVASGKISAADRWNITSGKGLAGVSDSVEAWLEKFPNATQAEIDAALTSAGMDKSDAQSPYVHGYQVATDQTTAAQKYLRDNKDVAAWLSSQQGKDYIKDHPEFDAADIAYTHYKRYGEKEGRKWGAVTCGPGYKVSADGLSCVPDTKVVTPETQCPSGQHYDATLKMCVLNTSATQNTSTDVTTPTSISTAPASSLPVGISGAGITTINPNGTVTTRPDIPGIPEGGFTGMTSLRDAYTAGGGSLGYVPYAPKDIAAFDTKYTSKLTGGSKQSYDYLTGKTPYSPKPVTETGEIMKPYSESVLGIPMASSKKMYLFDPTTKTYKINPDYAIPTYDKDGKKSLNLTNADVKSFMDKKPSASDFYTWASTNNLSPEQIAAASERPINEISKLFTGAKDLVGDDGKIDTAKVTAKEEENIEKNWDEAAYLAANPSVADELRTGKSVSGQPVQYTSGYGHWLRYGKDQGWKPTVKKSAGGGLAALTMANGGMAAGGQFDLGGYSDGGRLLRGPGDGVSDSIPATIGNKRPARLADGEFVVPARIVSELGNGSTEAGARKLYAMMDRVQAARRGSIGKGKVAKNSRADKYLPA